MTFAFVFKVIFAVLAVFFVSYGLLYEDKFVAFEDMLIKVIKKQIYLHKRRKAMEKRRQQGSVAVPANRNSNEMHRRQERIPTYSRVA